MKDTFATSSRAEMCLVCVCSFSPIYVTCAYINVVVKVELLLIKLKSREGTIVAIISALPYPRVICLWVRVGMVFIARVTCASASKQAPYKFWHELKLRFVCCFLPVPVQFQRLLNTLTSGNEISRLALSKTTRQLKKYPTLMR